MSEGYATFVVTIAQKDRGLLEHIQHLFGGGLCGPNRDGVHSLVWGARKARMLASKVAPYLRIKRDKATVVALTRTISDARQHTSLLSLVEVEGSPELLWAYVAGFVDGDGSIGFYESTGDGATQKTPKLCIHQKNKPFLEALRADIGFGSVCKRGFCGPNRDQMHYLVFGSQQSKRLCEKLVPYLVLKKVKAEAVLQYNKKRRADCTVLCIHTPEIVHRYQDGEPIRPIAASLGLKPSYVNTILRKLGKTRTYKEAQQLRRAAGR